MRQRPKSATSPSQGRHKARVPECRLPAKPARGGARIERGPPLLHAPSESRGEPGRRVRPGGHGEDGRCGHGCGGRARRAPGSRQGGRKQRQPRVIRGPGRGEWVVRAAGGAGCPPAPAPGPARSRSWAGGGPQTALGTFLHFSLECPSLVPFQLPTLYRLHYTTAPFVM